MGFAGISPGSLMLVFLILLLLFGKNRIKEMAEELGSAVKLFKNSMEDQTDADQSKQVNAVSDQPVSNGSTESAGQSQTDKS